MSIREVQLIAARDSSLAIVTRMFEDAEAYIEKMKDGEKIAVTQLCEDIGKQFDPPIGHGKVYPVVRIYLERYPGIEIHIGPKGGLYKGKRPAGVLKAVSNG